MLLDVSPINLKVISVDLEKQSPQRYSNILFHGGISIILLQMPPSPPQALTPKTSGRGHDEIIEGGSSISYEKFTISPNMLHFLGQKSNQASSSRPPSHEVNFLHFFIRKRGSQKSQANRIISLCHLLIATAASSLIVWQLRSAHKWVTRCDKCT